MRVRQPTARHGRVENGQSQFGHGGRKQIGHVGVLKDEHVRLRGSRVRERAPDRVALSSLREYDPPRGALCVRLRIARRKRRREPGRHRRPHDSIPRREQRFCARAIDGLDPECAPRSADRGQDVLARGRLPHRRLRPVHVRPHEAHDRDRPAAHHRRRIGIDYLEPLRYQDRDPELDLRLLEVQREQMARRPRDACPTRPGSASRSTRRSARLTLLRLLDHAVDHLESHVDAIADKRAAMGL